MCPFICSICWENLGNQPKDEAARIAVISTKLEIKVSSARCGHVFHDFCIRKWLVRQREIGQIKECPCCRIKIGCLKTLYLSISDSNEDENENITTRNARQMFFTCSICCENLESPPQADGQTAGAATGELEASLSSARCGHVFHDFCIRRWLVCQRNTGQIKTCPCCRTKIGCLKTLYVSIHDNDDDINLTPTIPNLTAVAPSLNLISKPTFLRWPKNNRLNRSEKLNAKLSLACRTLLVLLGTAAVAIAIWFEN